MATVTFSAADDLLYAYLAGEIDHDAAQNLRIQLDDALLARTPKTLVLDLGGVGFMDSSGVGLILGRQRCARSLGGTLRIQHAPERKTRPGSNLIPSASTKRMPAVRQRLFWPGMTPPCPSWLT